MAHHHAPSELLGRIPVEQFAEQAWGRTPLLVVAAGDRSLAGLLDLEGCDELLSRRGLRTPFVRVAKDGDVLASSTFTSGAGVGARVGDQVDPDRISELLGEGATVVLQGLHRTWDPVRLLCTQLQDQLGHPVQANAYLTPPMARGFAAHHDTHDVFVVQTVGTKHWVVHEPAAPPQRPAFLEHTMRPGDILYLPRGWVHSATTDADLSLHLTIGVHPYLGRDVARAWLEQVLQDEAFDTALPVGLDLTDPDDLGELLHDTRRVLVDTLTAAGHEPAADALAERWRRDTRPEPVAPIARLLAGECPRRVRLRQGVRARLDVSGVEPRLLGAGQSLPVARAAVPALERLLEGSDLDAAESGPELVRALLAAGLVVPTHA